MITDLPTPADAAHLIPVNASQSHNISAQWIPIPDGPLNTTYGNTTSNYPSAFLVIQDSSLPMLDSTVTCSIKADWVTGVIVHNYLCWGPQTLQGILGDDDEQHLWDWLVTANVPASGVPNFQSIAGWERVSLTVYNGLA